MKYDFTANRTNIAIVTVVASVLIGIAVAAYFFPHAMGGGFFRSSGVTVDCNSPLFFPDPSDRRGIRPACGTSY